MTNKKFKIAAMSVALTACVAAQPLIANAADEVENTPDLPGDDSTQNTDSTSAQSSSSSVETNINQEEKDSKEAFGDNVDVKYDPATEVKDPATGSSTIDGTIEKTDPDSKDETGDGEKADGKEESEEKEETGDGEKSEDKGETGDGEKSEEKEETPDGEKTVEDEKTEEKEEIPDGEKTVEDEKTEEKEETSEGEKTEDKDESFEGSATKTETPESTKTDPPVPNPGAEPQPDPSRESTTEEKPDGTTTVTNPTVTEGTQTTTTTGSGTASGTTTDTKKETFDKGEFDLEKELGGKPDIDWDKVTENPGDYSDVGNGYKVSDVQTEDDRQTLTLTKTETSEGTMTSDDIAKLVDAEKTDLGDGSYVLKRTEEVKDESGKVVSTRTTYITVKEGDSHVSISTTTTLTVTREKVEHTEDKDITEDHYTYPSSTTIEDNKGNKYEIDLSELLKDQDVKPGGSYEVKKGDVTYEITLGQEDEGTQINYSLKDLAAMLDNTQYQLIDGKLYYVGNGEKAELEVDQVNALRKSLSISVKITNSKGDSTSGTEITGNKENAEAEAKEAAIKDALVKAAKQEGLTVSAEDIKLDDSGKWVYISSDGKNYTFNYTVDGTVADGGQISVDKATITDTTHDQVDAAWSNKVIGTAYVTGSTITEAGSDTSYDTGAGNLGIGIDFKTAPADATSIKYDTTTGRIAEYTDADGKVHKFSYSTVSLDDLSAEERAALEAKASREGWTTEQLTASLTRVDWEVWTKETTEDKTTDITGDTVTVRNDSDWSMDGSDGKFTFTLKDGSTYSGLKQNDKNGNVYSTTDDKGVETTITIETSHLGETDLRNSFDAKFGSGKYTLDTDNKTVTYEKDGKTYTASYSDEIKTLKVEVRTPHEIAGTGSSEDDAKAAFMEKLKEEQKKAQEEGYDLIINMPDGTQLKITESTSYEELKNIVNKVVNYTAMNDEDLIKYLEKQKSDAIKNDQYYSGSTASTWYEKPDGTLIKDTDQNFTYWNGTAWYWTGSRWVKLDEDKKITQPDDYIGHLDLATDSKLDLIEKNPDGTPKTDDCVLVEKTLEWNKSAEDLVNGKGNTTVGLIDRITYDDENDNDPNTGHFEFPRASWDSGIDNNQINKAPTESVFYKVTGKVAYGKYGSAYEVTPTGGWELNKYDEWVPVYKDSDYAKAKSAAEAELERYKAEHPELDLSKARVVEICTDQDERSGRYYQIYLYESELTAYGYLSDGSNTCGNHHNDAQNSKKYVGGYDLTLGDLTQVSKEEIVAIGKNTYNCSATFTRVDKQKKTNTNLSYADKKVTETITHKSEREDGDNALSGTYNASYRKDTSYATESSTGIQGTGDSSYDSYDYTDYYETTAESNDLTASRTDGIVHLLYHTVNDADLNAETKETVTVKNADVKYTYTTIETSDVLIPGEEIVEITPERPDDPSDDENTPDTPDSPVLPTNPELPPVQDARPDEITETAVLPTNPVLPPVQDARMDAALPQTGVNWLTAIGLALSGVTLMAAGAFTTLTGKGKKEQH